MSPVKLILVGGKMLQFNTNFTIPSKGLTSSKFGEKTAFTVKFLLQSINNGKKVDVKRNVLILWIKSEAWQTNKAGVQEK